MADQQQAPKTLADHFNESITTITGGVKSLTHAGIPAPQAAEIATKMFEIAGNRAMMERHMNGAVSNEPQAMREMTSEERKEQMFRAIREAAPRLGVTREELAELLPEGEGSGDHEGEGAEAGPKSRRAKKHETPA